MIAKAQRKAGAGVQAAGSDHRISATNPPSLDIGRTGAGFCRSDMGHVHQIFFEAMHVEHIAAGPLPKATARFARTMARRLKLLAGIPQRIFSRGPIPLIAPFLKIRFGSLRQKHLPCALEIGAGLIQCERGTALMFARMRARIEATGPLCRRGYRRNRCASIRAGGPRIGVA